MIKKNTKVVFEGENNDKTKEMPGGMPLSKGEIVHFNDGFKMTDFEVINKNIEYIVDGDDDIVNITYTLKKSS
jgi:hypothetical protein